MKCCPLSLMLLTGLLLTACVRPTSQYDSYDDYPVYSGDDLGVTYTPERTRFRLWSPAAEAVRVRLYEHPVEGEPLRTIDLQADQGGTWLAEVDGELQGRYYTFQIKKDGQWLLEKPDPYARAVGTNGRRGMIVDLAATDPPGWENDQRPPLEHPTDIIVYELHIRDLSMHAASGIQHQGKFLGLTETGTTNADGLATGLDHIKAMGVTHVHLLPAFDFRSNDESQEQPAYNWGYDPLHYNVPEGSYSTDPADGRVRIREFKQMVKTLHDHGLRVILDVVYNHTGDTEESVFNQLVPGYYYRQWDDGSLANASACGNETASDRAMFRQYMIESVKYWIDEYHLDGFRFDLMGIHDIETMNQISAAVHAIDSSLFIYGEGWTAGDSPLPYEQRALKRYTHRLQDVAAFSDNIRDGIKGHVFTPEDRGFASGKPGMKETIKFGIVASTQHPQVLYDSVHWLDEPRAWAAQPAQTMTYVSCHDNHTLWDRLTLSVPKATEAERIRMHKLAGAIVLTSQGVSFLHAGVEMLRTKQGVENSYESPDSINQLDWSRKTRYLPIVRYFQDLIEMRKAHPAFRMRTTEDLQQHLAFLETGGDNLIAYTLDGAAVGDSWANILVILNGHQEAKPMTLPAGEWRTVLNESGYREDGFAEQYRGQLSIPATAAWVLVQE